MYILWCLDIKNQEVFYNENINWVEILWGMPVIIQEWILLTSSPWMNKFLMNIEVNRLCEISFQHLREKKKQTLILHFLCMLRFVILLV